LHRAAGWRPLCTAPQVGGTPPRAHHVKLAELDALVEGNIVDLDARAGAARCRLLGLGLVVEQQLVVET
jgi:hypothetical protein